MTMKRSAISDMELPASTPAFLLQIHHNVINAYAAAHRDNGYQAAGKAHEQRDHIGDP